MDLAKKLEKKNKENIRHLITVLYCLFSNADDYIDEVKDTKNKKTVEKLYKKSYKKWDEAEKYLRDYINN